MGGIILVDDSSLPTKPERVDDTGVAVTLGGWGALATLGGAGGNTLSIVPATDLTDGSRWISGALTAETFVGVMGVIFVGGGVSSESVETSESDVREAGSGEGVRFAIGLRVAASTGNGGISPLLEF
jgi:hypothetical protein